VFGLLIAALAVLVVAPTRATRRFPAIGGEAG